MTAFFIHKAFIAQPFNSNNCCPAGVVEFQLQANHRRYYFLTGLRIVSLCYQSSQAVSIRIEDPTSNEDNVQKSK